VRPEDLIKTYLKGLALLQEGKTTAIPIFASSTSQSFFPSLSMSSILGWTKAACLLLLATEAFASPIEKIEQLEKRAVCTAYSMNCYLYIVSLIIVSDIESSPH
jgi:hypothetical protein